MATAADARQTSGLKELLIKNKTTFIRNLEVNTTIRKLYQAEIISEDEYNKINSNRDRREQRKKIFEILEQKTHNHWEEPFRRILEQTNQTYLITEFTDLDGSTDTMFGHTLSGNNDYVIRVLAHQTTEDHVINASSKEVVVEEATANNVLDIRPGSSICIHVRGTVETIKTKFTSLIEKVEMADDVTMDVEVYQMTPNSFFDEYFPTSTPILPDKACSRCLCQTIQQNEEFILGQIESDIIAQTFKKSANVSDYIKNGCSSTKQPRVIRAKRFLMHVLTNKNVLHTFFEVCKTMGLFDSKMLEYRECKHGDVLASRSRAIGNKEPILRFKAVSSCQIKNEVEEPTKRPGFKHKNKEEEPTKLPGFKDEIPY